MSDALNTKEAARFVGLAVPTLYTMAAERRIPHYKISNRLRFDRRELEEWLSARHFAERVK